MPWIHVQIFNFKRSCHTLNKLYTVPNTVKCNEESPVMMQPGIDILLSKHKDWLTNKRIGLVTHLAAVDSLGITSARRLWEEESLNLVSLFGPEHGFSISGAAGATCPSSQHPSWDIPIHSLYGNTRKPTDSMLQDIDTLVIDLQDLGFRPYSYVSTLKLVMEAASEQNIPLIVADRPVPLPRITDGPVTETGFSSFVALIDAPMAYGMTPGETALWIDKHYNLDLNLCIAKMQNYTRQSKRGEDWPSWVNPSPAIPSWESAMCFPATVFCEALRSIDCGRATDKPFQFLGAKWMRGEEVCDALTDAILTGFKCHPHRYAPHPAEPNRLLDGIRISVTSPHEFRPIEASLAIIQCLRALYGQEQVWEPNVTRNEWFDKLYGTDSVRKALCDAENAESIAESWKVPLEDFEQERKECLLYPAE